MVSKEGRALDDCANPSAALQDEFHKGRILESRQFAP
jgi:hypothetical protein